MIPFLVEHEGGDGSTSVGPSAGLTTNPDSGTTPAVLVLSTGDRASRHRHG